MKNGASTTRGGFTLIELLVVISVISLLSSVILASLGGAREGARDSQRASHFNQLRTAINIYYNRNGVWPGSGDENSQISENCSGTQLYQDLVGGGYMSAIPTDPSEDFVNCTNSSSADGNDFFYGYDYTNLGGDICIIINNFEGSDDGGSLSELNQAGTQPYGSAFGSQANATEAEFVFCLLPPDTI